LIVELRCAAVNAAWYGASLRLRRRFLGALRQPGEQQERRLLDYVRANRETAFGREHTFPAVRTIDDFRACVPIRTYDDLEPWIDRVAGGEPRVLTAEPVERLVPSSGSTAASKLIPFTRTLRAEFGRAVDVWMSELFRQNGALLGGPAYWSISPPSVFAPPARKAAVPIGFDSDARYLGRVQQAMASAVMAVPAGVARLQNTSAFLYATSLFLLLRPQLRLISVWHPSFLERILDTCERYRERLEHDIERGTFTPPDHLAAGSAGLERMLRPNPRRARQLRALADYPRSAWPRLALVSCWGDGPSRGPADRLRERFPGIALQAKGLLATEGVLSLPFAGQRPLALLSHFYEFVDDAGRARLAHELTCGSEYSVVMTTGGGLYRYRLGDRIRVDGFVESTPSISFLGRDDRVSDLCGEKLSEPFVATALEHLFGDALPPFVLLAPECSVGGPAYTLFAEVRPEEQEKLAERLETELRRNPHYAWCVDLGQLRPARVVRVGPGAHQAYVDACRVRGQRLGEIKPAALRPETGWGSLLPCLDTREFV
jgi:hypothetical protein